MRSPLLYPLIVAATFLATPSIAQQRVDLHIERITIIDPENRQVLPDHSVWIDKGQIIAINPTSKSGTYKAKQRIDGTGQYLIPGLIDMHVHLAHPKWSSATLKLLIANGVTGVREMTGDCWEPRGDFFACIDDYRALQTAINDGSTLGPRLLAISSAIIRGPSEREEPHVPGEAPAYFTPSDAPQARQLAHYLATRNVDFAKVYNLLSKEVYTAFIQEASQLGLPVVGHVPMALSVSEAAALGHQTIEHARVIAYDCSDHGPVLREIINDLFAGNNDRLYPSTTTLLKRSVTTFNPERCNQVLKTLAEHEVWYVPTHKTREFDARASEELYRNDPRIDYISTELKRAWNSDLNNTAQAEPELVQLYKQFLDHGLHITQLAHQSGVKILAGTDANDTLSIPGFALHDELALLAQAGLPPMDILRTATTNPAEYLAQLNDLGGISKGKRADLLLLNSNPLDDIRHTTDIAAVIISGKVMDRTALDLVLAQVKTEASIDPLDALIIDLPESVLMQYAGSYFLESVGLIVQVSLSQHGLLLSGDGIPPLQVYPESEVRFLNKEDDTRFEFQTDVSNKVTGLRIIWSETRSEVAQRQESN